MRYASERFHLHSACIRNYFVVILALQRRNGLAALESQTRYHIYHNESAKEIQASSYYLDQGKTGERDRNLFYTLRRNFDAISH